MNSLAFLQMSVRITESRVWLRKWKIKQKTCVFHHWCRNLWQKPSLKQQCAGVPTMLNSFTLAVSWLFHCLFIWNGNQVMLPAPSPGIWLHNTSSIFCNQSLPLLFSHCVPGFWRGFHLNISAKEKVKNKRKCLCICNVWRMSTLFHAFARSLNDSWFGTYASQTFSVLLNFGCQSQRF